MTVDWEAFAERVPAGTQITLFYGWDAALGILIENKPYCSMETTNRYGDTGEKTMKLLCQPFQYFLPTRRNANEINYFIDGKWLTFSQVMADAS